MGSIKIYEVLRIIDAKPLFWEDHFQRFNSSIFGSGIKAKVSETAFINELKKAIKLNKLEFGNIKIILELDKNTNSTNLYSEIIPHKYPSENDYINGVKTISINIIRDNPSLKIWNQDLRTYVNNIIAKQNVYELIYINDEKCVTEGSRSNLFFIKDNFLISPPEKHILNGITRKYIIELALNKGIEYLEKDIQYDEISSFDSAFISGTSPKILPLNCIDEISFDVNNKYIRHLINVYNLMILQYLQKN